MSRLQELAKHLAGSPSTGSTPGGTSDVQQQSELQPSGVGSDVPGGKSLVFKAPSAGSGGGAGAETAAKG